MVSKKAITKFCETESAALPPLMRWYDVAKRADWKSLVDVGRDFPSADLVGRFTVFNIGGNKYRLIVVIKYQHRMIYIRHILTHAEYHKAKWKEE